jgi:hypothetical protein
MTVNVGSLADEIYKLELKLDKIKKDAEAKARPIKHEIEDKMQHLQLAMADAGLTGVEGRLGGADLDDVVKVSVKDPSTFFDWVSKNKQFQLLHKRVAIDAFRELMENRKGRAIPGLAEVTIPTLKIRKAK